MVKSEKGAGENGSSKFELRASLCLVLDQLGSVGKWSSHPFLPTPFVVQVLGKLPVAPFTSLHTNEQAKKAARSDRRGSWTTLVLEFPLGT